jgi:hypothetical protein
MGGDRFFEVAWDINPKSTSLSTWEGQQDVCENDRPYLVDFSKSAPANQFDLKTRLISSCRITVIIIYAAEARNAVSKAKGLGE